MSTIDGDELMKQFVTLFLLFAIPTLAQTAPPPTAPVLSIEGGVTVAPPQPAPDSQYRGIPDPSNALGFDVRADYTASQVITGYQGTETLSCTGTAAQPCLIDASGATFDQLTISGEYVVLQGGTVNAPADDGPHLTVSCTNCVVRDAEVSGPGVDTGHSSAVRMNSFSVWIGGSIHGFGDNRVDAAEQDFHGMKVMADDVWVLEAEIYDNSGDSIQVGDASRGSASRVYIGGGFYHHNRENAVDIKDSHDIVVSGVHMEGFRPTSSSPGEALVVHDDAYDARIYDNVVRDSTIGMVSSGAAGHIIDGNNIVALSKGIQIRNTQNITVTNNTISAPTPLDLQSGYSGTIQDQ
ncbi:MAG: right-handed parallel beta-helix repeat-containing protein [Candidatus Thiodiazotropha sp. (ex Semelilucina semeliformis)]|nr:right-handed parallel beta-helix repeat-containing protein [Candidatus Thiodiazotropha sp. (ex Semelilucina semeliformis)]